MRVTIAGLCFSDGTGVATTYDWLLVLTSYAIAMLGSYAALEMVGRMRAAKRSTAALWQLGSAVALGGGIWSMHFMAMLAMKMVAAVTYSPALTVLSLLIAIGSVAAGLQICGRRSLTIPAVCAAGLVIGAGVAGMHYIGMAAMLFPGSVAYRPGLWAMSVLIAVAAAVVALWLSMTLQRPSQRWRAALVMATAVCGMHYIGMAAAIFEIDPTAPLEIGVATGPLAAAVAGITLSLLVLALVLVSVDRRLLAGATRERSLQTASAATVAETTSKLQSLGRDLDQKRREVEQQKIIEQLLASVFMLVDLPMAIVTGDGEFLMTNPRFDGVIGYPPGALIGQLTMKFVTPICRQPLLALRSRQMVDRNPYSVDSYFLRGDASVFCMRLTSVVAEGEGLQRFRIITLGPPLSTSAGASPANTAVASKIRFVGLDELRAMLGADWAAVAESVMQAAIRIVTSNLHHGEAAAQSGDCSIVIRFAGASELTASERAAAIGQTLRDALIGMGQSQATVETLIATASAIISDDAGPQGALAPASIDAALDTSLEQAASLKPRSPRLPFRLGISQFEPVLACTKGELVGHFISLATPGKGVAGIRNHRPLSPSTVHAQVLASLKRLSVHNQTSETFGLIFVDLDPQQLMNKQALDLCTKSLRNSDAELRARLVIMLSSWPAGLPFGRIVDMASVLKPFCHAIGFSLDEARMPKFDLSCFGSPYVAIDARGLEDELSKDGRVEKFVLQLHMRHALVVAREVPSITMVRHFMAAGVDFISMETEGVVGTTDALETRRINETRDCRPVA